MEHNPYAASQPEPHPLASPSPSAGRESMITDRIYDVLGRTKPWVRFLAVLGFIGAGFMILGGVFMLLGGGIMAAAAASGHSSSSSMGAMPFAGFQVVMAVFYLAFGFLYLFPALKLWKYGTWIGQMLLSRSVADLEEALNQQRSFWKFVGIMALIMMAMYALIIVVVVIAAVVGFSAVSKSSGPWP